MEEIWKDIEGYEKYQVSNLGRIRHNGKILKPSLDRYGYLCVHLSKDGFKKTFRVHRLVAMAFIPNPEGLPCINHKSEIKSQNTVWVNEDGTINPEKSNLEWCSWSYNNSYNDKAKKIGEAKSMSIIQATLNNVPIKRWPSCLSLKKEGYFQRNVWRVLNGERKSAYNSKWFYCNFPVLYEKMCLSLWPTGETSGSVGQGNQLRFNWLGCKTEYGGELSARYLQKDPEEPHT